MLSKSGAFDTNVKAHKKTEEDEEKEEECGYHENSTDGRLEKEVTLGLKGRHRNKGFRVTFLCKGQRWGLSGRCISMLSVEHQDERGTYFRAGEHREGKGERWWQTNNSIYKYYNKTIHKFKLINKHKLKQNSQKHMKQSLSWGIRSGCAVHIYLSFVFSQMEVTASECDAGVCYLVFLNERPESFALALAGTVRFVVRAWVSEAGLRHRPLHRLTVVFKLHIARRLEPRLIRLYDLRGVLRGKTAQIVLMCDFCLY